MQNQFTLGKEEYTVLVVDDEMEVVNRDVFLLQKEGYKAVGTQSGLEAIDIVKKQNIDILLLDFFMPEISGEEVVRQIRKFNQDVIIILQTGYTDEKPPLELIEELDIQGYHDKTEGPEKLFIWVAAAVRSCMRIRKLKDALAEALRDGSGK